MTGSTTVLWTPSSPALARCGSSATFTQLITGQAQTIFHNLTVAKQEETSVQSRTSFDVGNVLSVLSGKLDVLGDWTNGGTFIPSGGTVAFVGSHAQADLLVRLAQSL